MISRVSAIVFIALCCIATITEAARYKDGDFMTMARSRRTPHGVVRMRGYVGVRRGDGMAFAGGYAGARTQTMPAYASPEDDEADDNCDPVNPVQDKNEEEESEPQNEDEPEEEEVTPAPPPPKKPVRGRPSKPQKPKPQKPASDEDDFPPPPFGSNKGRGGATAVATSYSNGKGAVANSHAIAYDGDFTGGQFKHKG